MYSGPDRLTPQTPHEGFFPRAHLWLTGCWHCPTHIPVSRSLCHGFHFPRSQVWRPSSSLGEDGSPGGWSGAPLCPIPCQPRVTGDTWSPPPQGSAASPWSSTRYLPRTPTLRVGTKATPWVPGLLHPQVWVGLRHHWLSLGAECHKQWYPRGPSSGTAFLWREGGQGKKKSSLHTWVPCDRSKSSHLLLQAFGNRVQSSGQAGLSGVPGTLLHSPGRVWGRQGVEVTRDWPGEDVQGPACAQMSGCPGVLHAPRPTGGLACPSHSRGHK